MTHLGGGRRRGLLKVDVVSRQLVSDVCRSGRCEARETEGRVPDLMVMVVGWRSHS